MYSSSLTAEWGQGRQGVEGRGSKQEGTPGLFFIVNMNVLFSKTLTELSLLSVGD